MRTKAITAKAAVPAREERPTEAVSVWRHTCLQRKQTRFQVTAHSDPRHRPQDS